MKAFLFDLVNKLQRTSDTLDAKAILCNKTWRVFSDSGEKEVYIFMEDGKLVISVNGAAVIGSWMYIPANQSLVISGNNQNFLVHPIVCNNVLALALDGSNQCCFLLDSTKAELESIQSLRSIESYISKNANKMPLLSSSEGTGIRNVVIQNSVPSDAIYATDNRLKVYEECIWDDDSHTHGTYQTRLYIKGFLTYKKFTGKIITSRLHFEYDFTNGRMWRWYMYHQNKQLAMEAVYHSDEDDGEGHFYDENGYELSEEAWDSRYNDLYERIYGSEADEFDNITNGGLKDN